MEESTRTISVLVDNHSGVLSRISGLFARRGYNIESLAVCATEDERYSRMTIICKGDEGLFEQIYKQLKKQIDVKYIAELAGPVAVSRELLLIKIAADASNRSQIMDVCTIFGAKTIDLSVETIMLELTGDSGKVDSFIEVLKPYTILELARSGISALQKGKTCIKNFAKD